MQSYLEHHAVLVWSMQETVLKYCTVASQSRVAERVGFPPVVCGRAHTYTSAASTTAVSSSAASSTSAATSSTNACCY
jgi:hypothetical protein